MSEILKDWDTLALGNGFFINKNIVYFFSSEELEKIRIKILEGLKKKILNEEIIF